jgi:hypothetical protein
MPHVMIGFAEALPAPEVVFSLLDAGHEVSAFTRDTNTTLRHLPLKELHVIPAPEHDAKAAFDAIRTLMAHSDAADYILPLDDGGLWLVEAALGPDPRIAGATGPQRAAALDKSIQVEAAAKAGLPLPATSVIRQPKDLEALTDFPVIAKPALAVTLEHGQLGKGDATYLAGTSERLNLQHDLTPDMDPLLVQPLVAGVGEGVFGYATVDGVRAWSGHARVRMMNPHGSGSSACISKMPDDNLQAQITAFLQDLDWRGPFMVELLRDARGTPWFMELNGRMWGSMALARRQGLEYPAWVIQRAIDPNFVPPDVKVSDTPMLQRHLGREILHMLFLLRGPKSDFHKADWPKFWTSLRGVLSPTQGASFYNYDPAHKRYFLRDAWAVVKKAVRR